MSLVVKSHVARDFLQSSAYFNSVAKIVWEYVSNSLDNPQGNQPVHCRVQIGGGKVVIEDDGRGMSHQDLERFFTMHGENQQRAQGRTVRGRFGTGKSAAFGMADTLRVVSVKDGLRNAVELNRADIEAARDGQPFAVSELARDEPVTGPSGTRIEIEGLATKSTDVLQTKGYVERRLGRYRQGHQVLINNHVAEFEEPVFTEERTFDLDSGPLAADGPITMVLRVSPTPLDESSNGVDILSRGIWHELTLAGLERQDHIDYLFGSVDVPALEDDKSPIQPFDNTRSGRLNPANELVVELHGWIRACLDEVRTDLVARDRARRKTAEAQRLQEEADQIATVLNRDFDQWKSEFRKAAAGLGKDLAALAGDGDGEVLPGDGEMPSSYVTTGPPHGDGSRGEGPAGDGPIERPGSGLMPGEGKGSPAAGEGDHPRRRRGGFSIGYENATAGESRSRFDEEDRTIWINLDHPQISAAKGEGIDRTFRQLSYEVAFTEYGLAIAREMARAQGQIFDAEDAIVEVGLVVNRISRLGAFLYNSRAES